MSQRITSATCTTIEGVYPVGSVRDIPILPLECEGPGLRYRNSYLTPGVLISRLNLNHLAKMVESRTWGKEDRPSFMASIGIGFGPALSVWVKELTPVFNSPQQAFIIAEREQQPAAVKVDIYNLPLVMDGTKEMVNLQMFHEWIQQTSQCFVDEDWAEHWIPEKSNGFVNGVLKVVGEYFRADFPQHTALADALKLSFFNYIYCHTITFPDIDDDIMRLQANIVERIPARLKYVSSSILNLHLKTLALPLLRDTVDRTLQGLDNLLGDHQNVQNWRRDLVFCVSFVVLAYLGRTQISVLQYAQQPPQDGSPILSLEAATEIVLEMEQAFANHVITYQQPFFTPEARQLTPNAGTTEMDQICSEYAEQFGLMGRIENILKTVNIHSMLLSLEPDCTNFDAFLVGNTDRLCRKYVHNILNQLNKSRGNMDDAFSEKDSAFEEDWVLLESL